MTIERPMFPPSRRGFFAIAGGAAVAIAAQPAIAAPEKPLDASKAAPALRTAIDNMNAAADDLTAAKATVDERLSLISAWHTMNAKPTSRRAIKRWRREYVALEQEKLMPAMDWRMDAEDEFRKHQMALARIDVTSDHDRALKACCAIVFDSVKMTGGNPAVISFSVAMDLAKQGMRRAEVL